VSCLRRQGTEIGVVEVVRTFWMVGKFP